MTKNFYGFNFEIGKNSNSYFITVRHQNYYGVVDRLFYDSLDELNQDFNDFDFLYRLTNHYNKQGWR